MFFGGKGHENLKKHPGFLKNEAPSPPRSRKGFYRLTEAEIDAHLTVTRLDSKNGECQASIGESCHRVEVS